jgi:hypothetical protein
MGTIYRQSDNCDVIAAKFSSTMPQPPPSSSTPFLFPGCRIFHFADSNLVRNRCCWQGLTILVFCNLRDYEIVVNLLPISRQYRYSLWKQQFTWFSRFILFFSHLSPGHHHHFGIIFCVNPKIVHTCDLETTKITIRCYERWACHVSG